MYAHDSDTASLAESYTELTETVTPADANDVGRALGGTVLGWMDACATVAARRFAREQVVTAAMDHVAFRAPVERGDVVTVHGYAFAAGDTSVDVTVDVRSERPETGDYEATATSCFTMVAVDRDGASAPVPDLECPTDAEVALRTAALDRRDARGTVRGETGTGATHATR